MVFSLEHNQVAVEIARARISSAVIPALFFLCMDSRWLSDGIVLFLAAR